MAVSTLHTAHDLCGNRVNYSDPRHSAYVATGLYAYTVLFGINLGEFPSALTAPPLEQLCSR